MDEIPDHCSHDPRQLKGYPIGMYHCPECGEMCLAGIAHPRPISDEELERLYAELNQTLE